jgi:L-threonylcarbamoyladenylate synthase
MIITQAHAQALRVAAQSLKDGSLVAFPTETVYGLGADAENPSAVAKIFELKGRPKDHPLIVHLSSTSEVDHFASEVPAFAKDLMARFWPGPLTLILKKRLGLADAASGEQPTIGLRIPRHEMALSLLKEALSLGVMGVAAPSANRFGRVSPTRAQHVLDEFGESLTILDGGACDIGIESTIVDCTRGTPILLRPGQLLERDLVAFAPQNAVQQTQLDPLQSTPKASGTLLSHYAPKAKVRLMHLDELIKLSEQGLPAALALWTHLPLKDLKLNAGAPSDPIWRAMPQNAQACAHELFATLRDFDAMGVAEIWVQSPPPAPEWLGVLDRLRRAAHV